MTITVRHAVEADHLTIVAFQIAMADETEGLDLDEAAVSFGVEQVLLQKVPGFYAVAEIDGRSVGCVMVNPEWSDWSGKMQFWLNSIYVEPPYRRRGVLRAMFDFVIAQTDPETAIRIKLYVDMKLKAMRINDPAKGEQEASDIRNLMKVVGVNDANEAVAIMGKYYPKSAQSPEKQLFLLRHLMKSGVQTDAPEYPTRGL